MAKTIVIFGFGPGISTGVAEKFGAEGFQVALVGRTRARLESGVAALAAKGIRAASFIADAGKPAEIIAALAAVKSQLGPVTAIHWNAIGGTEAPDLLTANPAALSAVFDVAIVGLLTAIQTSLPDLKAAGDGAVLITNGGFGDLNAQVDGYAVTSKNAGIALANGAKQKLVGLLVQQLKAEGIHVAQITIAGSIKGTSWEGENPIAPSTVGDKFFELYRARGESYARLS